MSTFSPTSRTEVHRLPKRGVYDKDRIYAILDEGVICHVGFVVDGQPFVIPTGYARQGDHLYLHGSPASRMLGALAGGIECCVTVTLLDGFVLARSAFHHSMNYRSVVVLGRARFVEDAAEKEAAMRCFTNHIVPGRWDEVRPVTSHELKSTTVLALPLTEASAKIRTGPPIDDEEDYALPIWAGVVPLETHPSTPIPDARISPDAPAIDLSRFTRSRQAK